MNNDTLKFEKLTPKANMSLDVYSEAIDFAFKNPELRNIAISGAYGSGKSSVLESYKNQHHEKRFIHISLAHFVSRETDKIDSKSKDGTIKPGPETQEITLASIEGKIINQLIHQIPESQIPQTRFKVKQNIGTPNIAATAFYLIVLLLSIAYLVAASAIKSFADALEMKLIQNILYHVVHPYVQIAAVVVLIFMCGLGVYSLVKIQKNKNLVRKLSIKGNEIEIFENTDESYFDKYLNEVLYLFKNCGAQAIVFEDLDRYNMGLIFERLREVNTLINSQLDEGKQPLKFFYLLRDDIFISKDRVKFFDFIVPIIPVIDSSNSYEQIVELFKASGSDLSSEFLQGLSLYIDDMRLLKNIFNEYIIYYNRLNPISHNCNKMLAMITYKNIFPKDFCDLQLNRGCVFGFFNNKQSYVQSITEAIESDISDYQERITAAQNEHLKSQKELDLVFEPKKNNWRRELSDEDKIEYTTRKQAIEDRLNQAIPTLEKELAKLQTELTDIKSASLQEIINTGKVDLFSPEGKQINPIKDCSDVWSNPYYDLLKYLLREGYIDESYADYMTYFYEGMLTRNDKRFLRSVSDRSSLDPMYTLNDCKLVFSRLRLVDFDRVEILNYDLLSYMLECDDAETQLSRLVQQLKETKNYEFIGGYYAQNREHSSSFTKCLNKNWPEMFGDALSGNKLSSIQLHDYAVDTLYYSSDSAILEVNADNFLYNYIASTEDFLSIAHPIVERLIHGFKLLEILFHIASLQHAEESILFAIYDNSLYKLSFDNICFIYTKLIGPATEENLLHKNYTLISRNPNSSLYKYVTEQMETYMAVMLEACGKQITDEVLIALQIINNTDVEDAQTKEYMEYCQFRFPSISEIKDTSLWEFALTCGKIIPSTENLVEFFVEYKDITPALKQYINSFPSDYNFSELKDKLDSDAESFYTKALVCNDLDDGVYKKILLEMGYNYSNFRLENIAASKIIILIDTKIIKMTENNLVFIREIYHDTLFHFIKVNMDEYVQTVDEIQQIEIEELLEILTWDISDTKKLLLLEKTKEPISIINKMYTDTVIQYIIKNNFDSDDFDYVVSHYQEYAPLIQLAFLPQAIQRINKLIQRPQDVPSELILDLLREESFTDLAKAKLLASKLPYMSVDEICIGVDILGLSDYIQIFDTSKRPTFPINSISDILLPAFQAAEWITAYSEDATKSNYYKINRKGAKRNSQA